MVGNLSNFGREANRESQNMVSREDINYLKRWAYAVYVMLGIMYTKEDKEDKQHKRWADSISKMLGSIDNKTVQGCSIPIVPDHLRESNKEAYTPKVVSIGPLHRRSKRSLLYMEEIKWRCMMSLLHRTPKPDQKPDPKTSLSQCSEAMYKLEEWIRTSYVDDLKSIDGHDLAKLMLLDGCFLLELLISSNEEFNTSLECQLEQPGPGALVAKNEEVLSDLILVENQIPFFVLDVLSGILFPDQFTEKEGYMVVNKLALSLLGYSPDNIDTSYKAAHLLQLLHSLVTGKLGQPVVAAADDDESNKDETLPIVVEREAGGVNKGRRGKLQLMKRCATRLQAAGVTIKAIENQTGIGIDLGIKLGFRSLEIPQLHMTATTEAKWRNLIAWEQSRNDRAQFVPDLPGETGTTCEFSCYALFIQGLICCVHDIKLLKDTQVIKVHHNDRIDKKKKMSSRDLLLLFNNIAEGVRRGYGDKVDDMIEKSGFRQRLEELNEQHSSVCLCLCAETPAVCWHCFRCLLTRFGNWCKKSLEIFKLEYTPHVWKTLGVISAVVLLGTSVAPLFLK